MDILIISNFCRGFEENNNNRFQYIANILSKDNEVELLTSNFRHGTKSHFVDPIPKKTYRVTMLSEPGYKTNVSIKRFYSHYVWAINIRNYLENRKKPDVIYCAVPTLKAADIAAKYCEKNNIKFVIDIQDLWPEAFKMVFNMSILSKIAFSPFMVLANSIYRRADVICAVSNTYIQRAKKVNNTCRRFHTVFLGTELSVFDNHVLSNNSVIKKDENTTLAYCGTLGSSYDLTCVFDALRILGNAAPQFIVMGRGPKKKSFEEYAKRYDLNVKFTDALPYPVMCSTLAQCDIAINPISRGAAASIINKHADYAAAGKPVISTQESKEYKGLVNEYEMGFNCNNSDATDIANKIKILMCDSGLRQRMSNNARKCAEERFDRDKTYQTLIEAIMD